MSLDAVGITSKNLKESVRFYAILGVRLEPKGGTSHYEGTTPSGIRIMLDSVDLMKKLIADWKEPVGSGVVLCFKQDSPKAVDELFSKVTRAGYKSLKDPWDAFWGQRYASVEDPDGNQIDIFASL